MLLFSNCYYCKPCSKPICLHFGLLLPSKVRQIALEVPVCNTDIHYRINVILGEKLFLNWILSFEFVCFVVWLVLFKVHGRYRPYP